MFHPSLAVAVMAAALLACLPADAQVQAGDRQVSRVQTSRETVIPVTPVAVASNSDWLRRIMVSISVDRPTPLATVIAMLAVQGLNISAPFPVDGLVFSGRIANADAETALRAILPGLGLDYVADDVRKVVTLRTVDGTQPAAAPIWRIERDERIDLALQRWATSVGWTLVWGPSISWECPSTVTFQGDFQSVAVQVVSALNADGKRLRLRIYESGQYMEVVPDAIN